MRRYWQYFHSQASQKLRLQEENFPNEQTKTMLTTAQCTHTGRHSRIKSEIKFETTELSGRTETPTMTTSAYLIGDIPGIYKESR